MASPQRTSTDQRGAYGTLHLDAALERYGFMLRRDVFQGVDGRWLEHDACQDRTFYPSACPDRAIWSAVANHMSRDCEYCIHDS